MAETFVVTLDKIIKEFNLEILYSPVDCKEVNISSVDVNRPGIQLAGFFEYFDTTRIQVIGRNEMAFMSKFIESEKEKRFNQFFSRKPPVLIISRGMDPYKEILTTAEANNVPVLRTTDTTSSFIAALIAYLNVELAPRITRHGVLVEIYGEGVLLLGESGVGKSETAIELVKRGHRLIADDAVEIRRVSSKSLVGCSPENIRHFIELRGIGIVNVRRIFGMGAVKVTEKIDMVIQLEQWDKEKVYDRMGIENEDTTILGLKVPMLTIPVKPGRNLAVIIEVAAMNNRQKKMGYNAAQELLSKLGMAESFGITEETNPDWDTF